MTDTLHHTTVTAPDAVPSRWALWLHGVFGSGQNFRTLARSFCQNRPDWGVVLVDLRAHGDSPPRPEPHTLATAAADLDGVVERLPGPVSGVLGHSFGGKVTLAWLSTLSQPLEHVFILDSSPSPRPKGLVTETAGNVLAMLEELTIPLASREAFMEHVVSKGYPNAIAQWLAMNVRRRDEGGYGLRVDLPAIRSMLEDYFVADLWSAVESIAANKGAARQAWLVVGGASDVVSGADRERLRSLGALERQIEKKPDESALAPASGPLTVTEIVGAGHWVHAEAPAAVLEVLLSAVPS